VLPSFALDIVVDFSPDDLEIDVQSENSNSDRDIPARTHKWELRSIEQYDGDEDDLHDKVFVVLIFVAFAITIFCFMMMCVYICHLRHKHDTAVGRPRKPSCCCFVFNTNKSQEVYGQIGQNHRRDFGDVFLPRNLENFSTSRHKFRDEENAEYNAARSYSEIYSTSRCAAVFPVCKNRDVRASIKEAWTLEQELQSSAGYDLWLCKGRQSPQSPPRSVSLDDIKGFNSWFCERKDCGDIDGVFIMLIAHGYTDPISGKSKVVLEDCDNFDIENWIVHTLAGTAFPVIICINSCRINSNAMGLHSQDELKATSLDVPKNVFLSWGAASGDLAVDGDFVDLWRLSISSDFMKKQIEIVALNIQKLCKGGKFYSGLDASKGICQGGAWMRAEHLGPSIISSTHEKLLVKRCINFAKRFSGENYLDSLEFERENSWQWKGSLQGKKVAVVEGELIVVICSDDSTNIVRGILYRKKDRTSTQVEALIKCLSRVKMTGSTAKRFGSVEEFLLTTQECVDKGLKISDNRERWFGGIVWGRNFRTSIT